MSKAHNRELTDPFQVGSKRGSGVPAFLRKKRIILLVLAIIGAVWVYTTRAPAVRTKEHELEDLLRFFVAAPSQSLPLDLDPSAELSQKSLITAAAGKSAVVPPVVVFSKTYCPYSKRAKNLLGSLKLSPEPFIVEVDLRDDADTVKALLLRLTGHGTFPNVIVTNKSIGGSDDLAHLHEINQLIPLLEGAGVKAGVV